MTEPLQTLANLATIFAVFGTSVAVASGVVPRVGPGRAAVLALKSLLTRAKTLSVRVNEVTALRGMLRNLGRGQYIVVTGQKGVGKTVIVDTVTQRTCGVTSVPVAPGTPQGMIVTSCLSEIANSRVWYVDPRPSARRVLWWYGFLLPRPILVLRAGERMDGDSYAGIPGAARELAGYGLRVLIDGSTNSLPPEVLATKRQAVLEVSGMPRDVLRAIPEYSGLFCVLREEGLEDAAWGVLGGVPADYDELVMLLKGAERAGSRLVVADFLLGEVAKAVSRRDRLLVACPAMRRVLKEFRVNPAVPESLLVDLCIVSPSPNMVLRAVLVDSRRVMLVPADPATALVLSHGWDAAPSIEQLQELLLPPPRGAYNPSGPESCAAATVRSDFERGGPS